jgi:hypothetical protein
MKMSLNILILCVFFQNSYFYSLVLMNLQSPPPPPLALFYLSHLMSLGFANLLHSLDCLVSLFSL